MLAGWKPGLVVSLALAAALALTGLIAARQRLALRNARASERRRRATEADLERRAAVAQDDLEALREALDSGVLRVDPGLRITDANPAAHELLGRSAGSLVGRSLMEAFLDPGVETIARSAIERGSSRRATCASPMPTARPSSSARVGCRVAAPGWSSMTSRSCAACSGSGPSSSTTCRTNCGRR